MAFSETTRPFLAPATRDLPRAGFSSRCPARSTLSWPSTSHGRAEPLHARTAELRQPQPDPRAPACTLVPAAQQRAQGRVRRMLLVGHPVLQLGPRRSRAPGDDQSVSSAPSGSRRRCRSNSEMHRATSQSTWSRARASSAGWRPARSTIITSDRPACSETRSSWSPSISRSELNVSGSQMRPISPAAESRCSGVGSIAASAHARPHLPCPVTTARSALAGSSRPSTPATSERASLPTRESASSSSRST